MASLVLKFVLNYFTKLLNILHNQPLDIPSLCLVDLDY